jgi:hypothetical protein
VSGRLPRPPARWHACGSPNVLVAYSVPGGYHPIVEPVVQALDVIGLTL